MLSFILSAEGYEVTPAGDGPGALDALSRVQMDLMLLDVMMPGMDGWQVLDQVRGRSATHDLPVLMISALNEPQNVQKAMELGANGFVTKPFDMKDLLEKVGKAIKDKSQDGNPPTGP